MKYILLILFPFVVYSQTAIDKPFFTSGSDTCVNTTSQDTLDWSLSAQGIDGPWNIVSGDYITGAEKAAGTVQVFDIANETGWTHASGLRVRIRSEEDTITSNYVDISQLVGAVTVFVVPDTSSGKTYYKVRVTGN